MPKQHVGSTITRFRKLFNHYNFSIKLYSEARRGIIKERFMANHRKNEHGANDDIKFQVIDYCDVNDHERCNNVLVFFYIFKCASR